jgi:hypothetical protein
MPQMNGYIGRAPGDSAVTKATQIYNVTSPTSTFTFNSGYEVGYFDLYLNGVRLVVNSDYTAGNGTTFILSTPANNGDVVEAIAFKAFNLGNVSSAPGSFSIGDDLAVSGNISAGGSITSDTGFFGDGSNLTNLPSSGGGDSGYANTAGIATVAQGLTGVPEITVSTITGVAATFTGRVGIGSTAPERKLDVLETASQTVAQFQTNGQTKALARFECVGDQPVFVGASRSDFDIEMGGTNVLQISHETLDIVPGRDINFNNGRGCDFAQQSAVTVSNAGVTTAGTKLEFYEEGTWTPVFSGSTTAGTFVTSGLQSYYVRVGNMVTVWMGTGWSSVSGSPAGTFQIHGLPYNYKANSYLTSSISWVRIDFNGSTATAPNNVNVIQLSAGTSNGLQIGYSFDNGWETVILDAGQITTSSTMQFCISYTTA